MASGPITADQLIEYRQKGYTRPPYVQFAGDRIAWAIGETR
jgi:hypothetical protein